MANSDQNARPVQPSSADEDRFNVVLAEYLERQDAGELIDREVFLGRHAELAEALREFFREADQIERMAGDFVTAPQGAPSDAEQTTITQSISGRETVVPNSELAAPAPVAQPANAETAAPLGNLGRYRLLRVLGQGAMGTVYLAEDTQLERQVALKVPKFLAGDGPELIARFYREARAAANLHSPNICPVHDVGEIAGTHFITMAYIEGRRLSDFIKGDQLPAPRQVMTVIRKLALALDEAHRRGVIHRDLKPDNIMVDRRGEPVIMDFGLARRINKDDVRLTQSGALVGSPAYMSPEQLTGDLDAVVPASDIYCLGVILYELLTGCIPFRGGITAVIAQILADEPSRPSQVRPGVDAGLEAVCLKMMAKKKGDRFGTMRDVADAMAELIKFAGRDPASHAKHVPSDPVAADPNVADPQVPKPAPAAVPSSVAAPPKQQLSAESPEINSSSASALSATAKALFEKHDYEQALQLLDAIPKDGHTPETRKLQKQAQAITKELAHLKAVVEQSPNAGEEAAFEKKLKRLLELQPGNRRARQLWDEWKTSGKAARRAPKMSSWSSAGSDGSRISWLGLPVLIGAGVTAALILFAIVIYFQSGTTTVKLVIEDESLKVDFAGDSFTFHPGGKSITVTPGRQSLTIFQDGTQIETKSFELKQGQNRLVTVSLVEGSVIVKADGVPLPGSADVSPAGTAADARPTQTPVSTLQDPAFQQWVKDVVAMTAGNQVEAVAKKLRELNPDFDGTVTPTQENGMVTGIHFLTDNVTDISPVQALVNLSRLSCPGSRAGKGKLVDLAPLKGMPLTYLAIPFTEVSDLSPLDGMQLLELQLAATKVTDLAPLKKMPLTCLAIPSTPVSDVSPLQGMKLMELNLSLTKVTTLLPLQDMPLRQLSLTGTNVDDLSPLHGMKMKVLRLNNTPVADLVPLTGMQLTELDCADSAVADLSPLKGMPITILICSRHVSDLSLLKDMPVTYLNCEFKPDRDTDLLRSIKTLETINNKPAVVFWKEVEEMQAGFGAWMKDVAAMPGEKQVEAVAKKLQELNPGFDGKMTPGIEGALTQIMFVTDNVTNISPLRAVRTLRLVDCHGSPPKKGKLVDLSPLKGLPLTTLIVQFSEVADLSPLKEMKLTILSCVGTNVADLSPLRGMPLTTVYCGGTRELSDLSPLAGMPLENLECITSSVTDLLPLRGMPLTRLHITDALVTDLSPLKDLPLKDLACDFTPDRDTQILRSIKTLETINYKPVTEFWKDVEEQQKGKKP